ncbi:hypothetical protein Lal_00012926 [Lupinus albus]|nr:hypothetical protein Lal_00012926 [Lupinus albus]
MGHAFYPSPFQFKNSTNGKVFSFSTSFALAIVPEYPKLGGHGLAFTIAPSKDLKALPSQYLGLLNSSDIGNFSNHIFAVEFDTVKDFEFGDINDNHVVNASETAGYYTDDSTKQDLTLESGKTILAWVDYDSDQSLVSVTLSPSSNQTQKTTLSFVMDLSPIFHDAMYVGFSASTGLLASSHYILGWSFKINGIAPTLDLSSLPQLPDQRRIKNADVIEAWELVIGPHRYSYKELKKATKGFKEKELLGQGGFGKVFKGTLPNSKTEVAVKRVSHESKQGLREFVSEIASIGRLRHRNLVQLLGWCRRCGDLLLVYDFMANGSLDKYLFDEPKIVLSWEQRFKIIKDVASGILYLHEGLYEHGSNPSTTRVVGTLGYLAPELPRTGIATTSTDVYAFGALLLEVACGRRPIEQRHYQKR